MPQCGWTRIRTKPTNSAQQFITENKGGAASLLLMAANDSMNETELELWLRIVHGAMGSLLLLCSILGSCLVLLLVAYNKKLRYPSIVISLGLVAADLILAVAWLLQVLAYVGVGDWTLGDEACTVFGVTLVWLLYVRWSEVAVVTMDRFLIVIFPFFTYKRYSKLLMITMTILAWVVPAALVLPSVSGFGRHLFRPQISACTVDCEGDGPCTTFYTALFGVFLLIGGVLPAVLYTTMYCIGLRKRWKYKNRQLGTVKSSVTGTNPQEPTSSSSSGNPGTSEVTNVESPTHLSYEDSQAAASSDDSPPRRRSRAFRLFKPRDRRALTTIFIIFLSMVITHIPIYVLSAIRSVNDIYESTPLIIHFASIYVFFLGPILDSVIIMRNKDFRDIFTNALRKQQVRPYNTARRPSVMLLLSVTGDRRNSTQPGQLNGFSRRDSNSIQLGNLSASEDRQTSIAYATHSNGLDSIIEEKLNSHTLTVDKQVSMDNSCHQYVTEV